MSKRKSATASKHASHHKKSAKARRATQAVVKSPGSSAWNSVSESSPKPVDAREEVVRTPSFAYQDYSDHTATALQDDCDPIAPVSSAEKPGGVSSARANAGPYQAKLLEIAHANIQFGFEFAQRIAAMRSPVEFPGVILEFAGKRIAMFGKHSRELAELS